MKNSKLFEMLSLFNEAEMQQFELFIKSNYHNSSKKCIDLYFLLKKIIKGKINKKKSESPDFWDQIYKNKNSLNALSKQLKKLCEQFVKHEHLKKKPEIGDYFLNQFLYEKESRLADINLKKQLTSFGNKKNKSTEDYLLRSLNFYSKMKSPIWIELGREEKTKILIQMIDYIDQYWVLSRLSYFADIVNHKNGEIPLADEYVAQNQGEYKFMMKIAENHSDEFLINIWASAIRGSKENNNELHDKQIDEIEKNIDEIAVSDLDPILILSINHYINKVIKTGTGYEEIRRIYQMMIERNVFSNKRVNYVKVKNFIISCVKTENWEKAKMAKQNYLPFVDAVYREALTFWIEGYLLFHSKDYKEAITFLEDSQKANIFSSKSRALSLNFDAQALFFKSFYESQKRSSFMVSTDKRFELLLDKYHSQIKRTEHKFDAKLRRSYLKFVEILRLLYKKKTNPNYAKSLAMISAEIDQTDHLNDRKWLREKTEEFY